MNKKQKPIQLNFEHVDYMVQLFDNLFTQKEFKLASNVLRYLDPELMFPELIGGILMITMHAKEELGDDRAEFLKRALTALYVIHHMDFTSVQEIENQFK